jgi:hypothetical protein
MEVLTCPHCPRTFPPEMLKSEPWRRRLYHCWMIHPNDRVHAADLELFLADKQRRDERAGRLV